MVPWRFVSLCWLLLVTPAQAAGVAWWRDGQMLTRSLDGAPVPTQVPLGSVWKLFVYGYLQARGQQEADYQCADLPQAGEQYCCLPGEAVARDAALARSCARYFEPTRLGITAADWRSFWQAQQAPGWLQDLTQMQPGRDVTLAELLQALAAMPAASRTAARQALLATALQGYGRNAWPLLGSGLRFKTFSWHDRQGRALGGAAGWLVDGTPFWFGASGASHQALDTWAAVLACTLPVVGAGLETQCVEVDFFARYPLQAVWQGEQPVSAGPLRGSYRLQFANGSSVSLRAEGELTLGEDGRIRGRLGLNDYVARVLEREGRAEPLEAARALAIAARSYVLQNGQFAGDCWQIADDSRQQRVSPNPPSAAAQAVAWFSDELVLQGVAVQYHQQQAAENRLSWQQAVVQAQEGWDFQRILRHAYLQATLGSSQVRSECQRLPAAEQWLQQALPGWLPQLQREDGYEPLESPVQVCVLAQGVPYADLQQLRLYVRDWRSLNGRVTLAHEFLHLALRFHPHGADEVYVERLARRLIGG